jgi:hypothetical protein
MQINFLIGISGNLPRADKSAVGTINDSVGKIGIDQFDQATSDRKRRMKRAERAKAFPGQHDACRETQQVCLYCTQKLVMQHELLSLSPCLVV